MGKEVDCISYIVPQEPFDSWPILPSKQPLIAPTQFLPLSLIGNLKKARLLESAGYSSPLLRIQASFLSFFRVQLHDKMIGVVQSPDGTLRMIARAHEDPLWYPRFVNPEDLYFVEAQNPRVPSDMVALGPSMKAYVREPLSGVLGEDDNGEFLKLPSNIDVRRDSWSIQAEAAVRAWPSVDEVNKVGQVVNFRDRCYPQVATQPVYRFSGERINPQEVAGVAGLRRKIRRETTEGYETEIQVDPLMVFRDGTYSRIGRMSSERFPRFDSSRNHRTEYSLGRTGLFIDLHCPVKDPRDAIRRHTDP